jgi:hypothetical protein
MIVYARLRRPQVDDCVVARELGLLVGVELFEKRRLVVRPIRESVERAAVAEREPHLQLGLREPLELALHAKDGALPGALAGGAVEARKPSREQDARRLRQDRDVDAERPAHELEDRGLACPRSAGDDDEAGHVRERLARARLRSGEEALCHGGACVQASVPSPFARGPSRLSSVSRAGYSTVHRRRIR